jgi:hypothetical protein
VRRSSLFQEGHLILNEEALIMPSKFVVGETVDGEQSVYCDGEKWFVDDSGVVREFGSSASAALDYFWDIQGCPGYFLNMDLVEELRMD